MQLRLYVAGRPFDSHLVRVGRRLEGLRDPAGRELAKDDRVPSLEQHLLQRTAREEQWPPGTSPAGYLADVRRAVAHDGAVLMTYRYHGEDYVAFLAPNDFTPPAPGRLRYVFVAYSATYGVVRTAYQASDETIALPRDGVERLTVYGP